MATTATDIVSDEDWRSIVEQVRNRYYIFRRAFRAHDGTDLTANSFNFPVSDFPFEGEEYDEAVGDNEVVEIPDGAEYPRAKKSYDGVPVAYTKYGFEVGITDEAVSDSVVDVEMDVGEDMAEAEESRMDGIAHNFLADNYGNVGSEIGDDDGAITFDDITEARQDLFMSQADISQIEMYASGLNMANLLSMDEFVQASELGDQTVTTGVLPSGNITGSPLLGVAGDVPVYLTNTHHLDEGEAFLVDTSAYGWESTRWNTQTSSYREEEKDQDVFKIRDRVGWAVTKPEMAVKIEA